MRIHWELLLPHKIMRNYFGLFYQEELFDELQIDSN